MKLWDGNYGMPARWRNCSKLLSRFNFFLFARSSTHRLTASLRVDDNIFVYLDISKCLEEMKMTAWITMKISTKVYLS